MSDNEEYPDRHPETGKVLNPITGNWVKPTYAEREDLLEQAEQHTRQHFKEKDEDSSSEDIDDLLKEAEEAEAGEAFDVDDEELLEEHEELPDSPFPDEDEFIPGEDEEGGFQQPPTPEGFEEAAQQKKGGGEYKGVYSGNPARSGPSSKRVGESQPSTLEEKHDNDDVRYERTEHGGMKMVYPDDEE